MQTRLKSEMSGAIKNQFFKLFVYTCVGILFPLAFSLKAQGSLAIRGEMLYFSPSYDETYFVINGSGIDGAGNPTPNGKRINNPVSYNFGFRVEGIYDYKCFDVGLRFTHLHSCSHEKVKNNDIPAQLWPTETIPNLPNVSSPFSGLASSQIDVMYHKAECLFQEQAWRFCCWQFTLREALEWSYIRYNERVKYIASAGSEVIQYHGHTKGIGPQFGMIILLEPWHLYEWYPNNLSLRFMTTASLIAANTKAKIKSKDILSARNKVTQSCFWRLVPEWSFDFGIQYFIPLQRCRTAIELGYEMTVYYRGISKLIFSEAISPGVSLNQYSNFDVHGVYLAFSILL